jgi:hypothetical protein
VVQLGVSWQHNAKLLDLIVKVQLVALYCGDLNALLLYSKVIRI